MNNPNSRRPNDRTRRDYPRAGSAGGRYSHYPNYNRNNNRCGGNNQGFFTPFSVMLMAAAVLVVTLVCAAVGVFGGTSASQGAAGAMPGYASAALRKGQPSQTVEIYRRRRVEDLLAGMSTEEKVGQLLLLRSHDLPDEAFCREISSVHAGGVVLFAPDIKNRSGEQLVDYISSLQQASDGRMLICVDEEGGTVVRVSSNRKLRSSSFRSPQQLYSKGGMELVASDGAEKARFLRQYGFNVNFAPVADVVTDSRAMMYRRAFGGDAQATAEYVRTVVEASESEGVGSCLKHFPGYGNTSGDTHNGMVTLDTSLEQLRSCDLIPFEAGIDAGCGAVMITHTIMSAIDPDRPASMSPAVMDILRKDMGFDGVIISDGMDMGAITRYSAGQDVCVTAFLAGIDLMCTPVDGPDAYAALLAAVEDGTISRERLDDSVRRILSWKLSLGLYPMQDSH